VYLRTGYLNEVQFRTGIGYEIITGRTLQENILKQCKHKNKHTDKHSLYDHVILRPRDDQLGLQQLSDAPSSRTRKGVPGNSRGLEDKAFRFWINRKTLRDVSGEQSLTTWRKR
jgi:hypothetical protein